MVVLPGRRQACYFAFANDAVRHALWKIHNSARSKVSIIIPISAFQSSDRRYFRMCPGHRHAPRAILFRDIMLDSSSFLPSDILVAIASNPLRQSVSAIRTPHGPLFPLPSSSSFSLFPPFFSFFYPLLTPSFLLRLFVSLYPSTFSLSISPPTFSLFCLPPTSFYFPTPNPVLFSFRLFVLFVSSVCPVSLFPSRICPSFHACASPLRPSASLSFTSFSTIYPEPRWNGQYICRRKTSS